jgi:2,3-dihydroxyethylbenzene 1,2-dioxygenase
MSAVTELGYVGLNIRDLAKWRSFATDIVGCEWVGSDQPGIHFLRMDDWHHRITLCESEDDDLAFIGWRVADQESLQGLARRLAENGIPYEICDQEEADRRHVMEVIRLHSPGGIQTEIFWGPQVENHKPFYPGRRMFGHFKMGALGLGHVAISEPDAEAALTFYKLLGFKGNRQYKIKLPNGMVARPVFMYCNDRQHSLQFDLGPMPKKINHMAIEYMDMKDMGAARDLCRSRGLDLPLDIGMHSNDQALSFYVGNPSGWCWELAWNSRKAPDQDEYYSLDIFGHEHRATGYGLDFETTSTEQFKKE